MIPLSVVPIMYSFADWILHCTLIEFLAYLIIASIVGLLVRAFSESFRIRNISRKAVFITGCDSGFGRALALKCLDNDMPVFAGCLTKMGIESLKNEALYKKGTLDAFLLNVGDDASVAKAAEYLKEQTLQYNGLHAVVNNAGITGHSLPDDFLSLDEYYQVGEINLFGVIRTTKAVLPLIKMAKGRVVTMVSICGRVGLPSLGPYTVSKYGVNGYCDVLRQEMRPFGVGVHILEPGFFKTPLIRHGKIQHELAEAWTNAPQEVRNEYGEKFFKDTCAGSRMFLDKISSEDIDWVVDSYFHAITSKFPRSRYHMGWDGILFFVPFSLLPTKAQDIVFSFIAMFLPKPDCSKL